MPGKLIIFSGLDGAGKSTQLELLKSRLDAERIKHVSYWSRGGYTPGMETAKAVVRRLTGKRFLPPAGHSETRTKHLGKSWKRQLWLRLAILDLWVLYAIRFRIQLLRGRYVLADRYWQDTLLDFRLNFPTEDVDSWWLWKCFLGSIPTPQHAFLFTIPIEESTQRGAQKNEPFPAPPEQLHYRALQYEAWSRLDAPGECAWHWLCGMRDPQDLADEIWSSVTTEASLGRGPAVPVDSKSQPNHAMDSRS